jgi:glycosyltransferase involved in cell wall biosynthesis
MAPSASAFDRCETGGRIAFDITALIAWYRYRRQVTGIQRVAERILTSAPVLDEPAVVFVARIEGMNGFVLVDRAHVAALGTAADRAAAIDHLGSLAEALSRRPGPLSLLRKPFGPRTRQPGRQPDRRMATDAALGPGDVLVNLADFWVQQDQVAAYERMRQRGCRLIQFIYDIIPVTHPHVCHPESIGPFRRTLAAIIDNASGYLVASNYVEREFAGYLARSGTARRPMKSVTLGWDRDDGDAAAATLPETLERRGLRDGGYLLQVGTIEPRKNHLLAVRALQRLYGKLGRRLPPTLFVGRLGWRTEPLLNELMGIDYLGGRIRILDDVDDTELFALYRGCRFTLFPSFVEGWGLPVQESLRFGKPCLASGAASIPEAGLDLADYIDPYDVDAFAAAMERWIVDDADIASVTARIAAGLARRAMPRWSDCARAILDFARTCAAAP